MVFGDGPGMRTRSRVPGATAGEVRDEVGWIESWEVVCVGFAALAVM